MNIIRERDISFAIYVEVFFWIIFNSVDSDILRVLPPQFHMNFAKDGLYSKFGQYVGMILKWVCYERVSNKKHWCVYIGLQKHNNLGFVIVYSLKDMIYRRINM